MRSGFTLLETMIAMALLGTVSIAVALSLQKMREYEALGQAQDDILFDADRIMKTLRTDIGASSWEFDFLEPDTVASGATAEIDRDLRYYPYVHIQDAGGPNAAVGTRFPHHQRSAGVVGPQLSAKDRALLQQLKLGSESDLTNLSWNQPGYYLSWMGPSQEVIFLKPTAGVADDLNRTVAPNRPQAPALRFSSLPKSTWRAPGKNDELGILHASGWSTTVDNYGNVTGYTPRNVVPGDPDSALSDELPYGVIMEAGLLGDPNAELSDVRLNWETMDGVGYRSLSPDEHTKLKEYSYCVVPSRWGLGRLVRAVRVSDVAGRPSFNRQQNVWADPGTIISAAASPGVGGMMVDTVLSDHVTRITFDTYRTVNKGQTAVTALDINQVKVRIYFARKSNVQPDLVISRLFETVVTMRARNSGFDKDPGSDSSRSLSSRLGVAPVGLP